MSSDLYLYLLSLSVFSSYVFYIWGKYGVLTSISESVYKLPDNLKILFTLFCWGFAFPLVIIATPISSFMFFAGAAIMFVGAAARFKTTSTRDVHYISAGLSVIFSQLALVISFDLWIISVIFTLISVLLTFILKENKIWWVELLAFASAYIGLGIMLF